MATTLVTRKARPDDLAEIDTLLGRSYPALLKNSYPPSLLVTAIPLISKAQPGLLASGTYFVVTDDDAIVGAGGWTRAKPGGASGPTSGVAHIRHVVTDHRRTRQGIGQRLMAHIFQTAKADGITWLECYSTTMAEPFYASVGFETIGPITIPLRPGIDFPAVHMRRVLA
ncbi:MAG: GNAT family N-acetyltransferase [Paracoccaceae bacterium]